MESKNIKVLEALQMQPLSEEEKISRHILGRLYGPIATTKEKTRNGRGYNKELWQKALSDEIFCEKVANKSLFLELGHPVDREETSMEKVCACIPELPKIVDGDLYAYVDILDTKNGRLLKTLCDYGFVPGISSRGTGDIMENNDVDPETFFLETWDIVQLPAVKKARLTMCESLQNTKNLSSALCESYAEVSSEEKKEIQETLNLLNLNIEIEPKTDCLQEAVEPFADIPWAPEEIENDDLLLEENEGAEESSEDSDDQDSQGIEDDIKSSDESEDLDKSTDENNNQDSVEEVTTSEDADNEETDTADSFTVGMLVDSLNDFERDLALEFNPINIDGTELRITELSLDDSVEGKVVINIDYDSSKTNDNIDTNEMSNTEESSPETIEQPETVDNTEEAVDDGDEEVIESLKEIIRQKDALEEEVLTLKNRQTVSDAEVCKLTENVERYKTGFMRVSELAAKSTQLQKEVTSLTEQLETRDETIRGLENRVSTQIKLTESIDSSNRLVEDLRKRLATLQTEAETTEQDLNEQLAAARAKTQECSNIAKAYKQKYLNMVEHYIASKATMLGVSTYDITSKLQENYSLEDIDQVCDKLLDAGRPAFGFGMKPQKAVKAKINESITTNDDGFDDLLILAGLK